MTETTRQASGFLKNESMNGENPEVFYYQYKIKTDSPGFILRMVFYGGLEVVTISSNNNEK